MSESIHRFLRSFHADLLEDKKIYVTERRFLDLLEDKEISFTESNLVKFQGESLKQSWIPLNMRIDFESKKSREKITDIMYILGVPVLSKRSVDVLQGTLSEFGEFLPINIVGKYIFNKKKHKRDEYPLLDKELELVKNGYFIFHVTKIVNYDVIDINSSKIESQYFNFITEKIENELIFKILLPENKYGVINTTTPLFTNNFITNIRDIIIKNKLTGFSYVTVWNENDGYFTQSQFSYRDIHGKLLKK